CPDARALRLGDRDLCRRSSRILDQGDGCQWRTQAAELYRRARLADLAPRRLSQGRPLSGRANVLHPGTGWPQGNVFGLPGRSRTGEGTTRPQLLRDLYANNASTKEKGPLQNELCGPSLGRKRPGRACETSPSHEGYLAVQQRNFK